MQILNQSYLKYSDEYNEAIIKMRTVKSRVKSRVGGSRETLNCIAPIS